MSWKATEILNEYINCNLYPDPTVLPTAANGYKMTWKMPDDLPERIELSREEILSTFTNGSPAGFENLKMPAPRCVNIVGPGYGPPTPPSGPSDGTTDRSLSGLIFSSMNQSVEDARSRSA